MCRRWRSRLVICHNLSWMIAGRETCLPGPTPRHSAADEIVSRLGEAAPDPLDPGETLELTLTVNTPTGTQTVTLSQTLAGDETLQDAAEGLLEDLAALTDGQGNPLGLSGDLVQVTIPGGVGTEGTPVPSIQSLQITAPQGSNLNTVELLVGGEIAAQSSIVQTDEHVSTLEIPSDVGDLSQSAQLDVLIAGPGFPVDAEGNPGIDFEFNIFPGQTPQNVADQLRNEIVSRLGEAAQETVDVRIETGEGGELSLVLQSSAGAITTDIDFESIITRPAWHQNINTVALPDEGELSNTLELTLTGLPGAGEVNLSQTLDAGETLLDAAQSLVADIATLTGSEGEPLGLSGEIVTVTTGAPGTGDPEVTADRLRHRLALLG